MDSSTTPVNRPIEGRSRAAYLSRKSNSHIRNRAGHVTELRPSISKGSGEEASGTRTPSRRVRPRILRWPADVAAPTARSCSMVASTPLAPSPRPSPARGEGVRKARPAADHRRPEKCRSVSPPGERGRSRAPPPLVGEGRGERGSSHDRSAWKTLPAPSSACNPDDRRGTLNPLGIDPSAPHPSNFRRIFMRRHWRALTFALVGLVATCVAYRAFDDWRFRTDLDEARRSLG